MQHESKQINDKPIRMPKISSQELKEIDVYAKKESKMCAES